MLLAAKQAGQEVSLSDTVAVRCEASQDRKPQDVWLAYDPRAKVVRARVALVAGQELGRVFLPQKPVVRTGDHVALTAYLGHVRISRDVVALQDAGPAQRFFVRDPEGQVFAIAAIEQEPQP